MRRSTPSPRSAGSRADLYVGRRLKDPARGRDQQSKEFKDEYVSSEHLLLALVAKDHGARQRALRTRASAATTC